MGIYFYRILKQTCNTFNKRHLDGSVVDEMMKGDLLGQLGMKLMKEASLGQVDMS